MDAVRDNIDRPAIDGNHADGVHPGDGRDLVADAAKNLTDIWGDLGPSEALTRALVAERNENREMAIRWARVFLRSVGEG